MQSYEKDVHAWSVEQAALLRERKFDQLDVEHLAEEIANVARSEERELARRLAELMASLLAWQELPDGRGAVARTVIRYQRKGIMHMLEESPSLAEAMNTRRWLDVAWTDAMATAAADAHVDHLPEACPWSMREQVLAEGWLPGLEVAADVIAEIAKKGRERK